jgi:hypothetical protein
MNKLLLDPKYDSKIPFLKHETLASLLSSKSTYSKRNKNFPLAIAFLHYQSTQNK